MRYLIILAGSICTLIFLVSCVPEAKKKCDDGQVLENGSCVLKEQHIVEEPTPNPTPVPTIIPTLVPTIIPIPTIQPKLSCGSVPHNGTESRIAFSAATVAYGQSCSSIQQTQTRTCNNGVWSAWSGSYTHLSCSVQTALACGTIASGAFELRTMYQAANVVDGKNCVSEIQNRKCTNGQFSSWSGTYTQPKCVISRIRYENAVVPTTAECNPENQTMTCEGGVCDVWLPNNYTYATCSTQTITFVPKQNLNEVMARKSRYSTATFSPGVQSAPYYFWQPETLMYIDINYGTEIWRMTYKPDSWDDFSNEYSTQAWSADGSRMGFRSVQVNIRKSLDPNRDRSTTPRWIVNSDGSKLRAGTGGGHGHDYLNWLHTENAYLFTPRFATEFPGAAINSLYKVTIDENNTMTRKLLISDIGIGEKSSLIKDPITSDDKWMVLQDWTSGDWPTPNNISSHKIHFINLLTNKVEHSWGVARGIGPVANPYGAMSPEKEIRLRGSSSAFINGKTPTLYAHYSNYVPHFIMKMSGSAADGGPAYADWNGSSFGVNDEIKVLDDNAASSYDLPHNPYDNGYMGHPAFDRWGHYVLGNNSQDCNSIVFGSSPARYIRTGNKGCPGLMVLDVTKNLANPDWVDANNSNYMIGTGTSNIYQSSHSSWTGWTDEIVSMIGKQRDLYQNNYRKTNQTGKANTQAAKLFVSTELGTYDNYAALPRPSQSPDGTKVAFSTILFASQYAGNSSDDDKIGISYAVAYYPHPPEITSVTGSGTYTIRFDWRTNQTISRGYTQRGWPDEATDDPPPPRETKSFRLWRSINGINWTPIAKTNADIFSRYNFSTGKWTGNNYWTFTDTPGTGIFYYAVTSIEHSGLESRTLSNVFNTTGNQTIAYPTNPKLISNYATTKATEPRYYNIYAKDGNMPTAIQQNRIASPPASAGTTYLDWLGNPDGSTKYLMTVVDTQGNEKAIPVSYEHTSIPGQYRLNWTNQ